MNTTKIREIEISDCISICEISSKELGYPCNIELVQKKISNLDKKNECVFVAIFDEKVVGYIHIEKYDVLYFETMANILGLSVKEEYQKKGIGKMLLLTAEKWALKNNIHTMRLNSGIQRTNAHEFYRHLGYNSEKKQLRFTKKI